jgi:hypothetical protein
LQHFSHANDPVLESDPTRELAEEFADTLKMTLEAHQFTYKAAGTIVENAPAPTEYLFARDSLTARVYRIFEVQILDSSLTRSMIMNSKSYSDQNLEDLALDDARNGGPGWANSVLVLSVNQVNTFYSATPPEDRNQPVLFQGHRLDETVAAVLENIPVPKYQSDSQGRA